MTGYPARGVRTGRPRWSSLRRWVRDLEHVWPDLVLPGSGRIARLSALLAAFGLGSPLREVLDAAVDHLEFDPRLEVGVNGRGV